jgi:hypothetical protein
MALYRLDLKRPLTMVLVAMTGLAACSDNKREIQTPSAQGPETLPDTTATADVDRRATLALKQTLVTNFPQNSPSAAVEAGLTKDGFTCGPNPAAPEERACLRAVREPACEINTIVRTSPYRPEKAQVIRICELRATVSPPT